MSISKYRISELAINDLNDIWLYTFHKWSQQQADYYYDLIIQEIEFITNHFMSGKSIEQTRTHYRYTKVKSHLIFYKKGEEGIIEIVRILHQRMDLKKHL